MRVYFWNSGRLQESCGLGVLIALFVSSSRVRFILGRSLRWDLLWSNVIFLHFTISLASEGKMKLVCDPLHGRVTLDRLKSREYS